MSGIWLFLSGALSLVLGLFLMAPLFEPAVAASGVSGSEAVNTPRRLRDAKERTLRALKDLELDHQMGKISSDDFERSSQELSLELAQILNDMRNYE